MMTLRSILVVAVGFVLSNSASAQFLSDPRILPGDIEPAPAVREQLEPQIARGGSGYLVVWEEARTALRPGFRNEGPVGPGLGSMTDIYAARLGADGSLLDITPIIVSQAPYKQSFPRVGWNGQNWLVAWMTQCEDNHYHHDIMATRVSPDGRVLDDPPIVILRGDTTINFYNPWSISSDGTNWVVAYRSLDSGAGIYTIDGTRVAPDGAVLDPGGKRLRRDFWNSYPTDADLAFAGDEYLLVWIEQSGLKGQRLTLALDPIGELFPVNLMGLSRPRISRVASDGNAFLVTWFEARYFAASQVFGARVSHDGDVLDPEGIAITGSGLYTQIAPAVVSDGTDYVVAYNFEQPGNLAIRATRVSNLGEVLDPAGLLVKTGPAYRNQPAIASGVAGGAQLVWTDAESAGPCCRPGSYPEDIYTATITASGQVTPDFPISLGAPRQTLPRLAPGGFGYLAVFRSEVSSESRILAQRLDATGTAIDQEPFLIGASPFATNPSVAWNGSLFLVVWDSGEERGQIYGRRVLPSGDVLDDPPISILPGREPDVAALGDMFLVVDADPITRQIRNPQTILVTGGGELSGGPVQVGPSFAFTPRVAAFGSRWLIVWQLHPRHDSPYARVAGAFFAPDGTVSNYFYVSSGPSGYAPHLAVAGESALIVWQGGNIKGRRILADGTLLDPDILISSIPQVFSPAVAWDGAQYLVDWIDHRNERFPRQPRGDIYGARVDVNGIVLDPDGFAIANSPLPEETPSVSAANGLGVFVYAVYSDQEHAAFRIAMRTIQ